MQDLDLLLAAGVATIGRFLLTDSSSPPRERWATAARFGAGTLGAAYVTRTAVRRGARPIVAGAVSLGAARVFHELNSDPAWRDVTAGAMLGSVGSTVATAVRPNLALGVRPRVFVSHAFRDSELYTATAELFDGVGLDWFDHSVPIDRQFDTRSERTLLRRLKQQIRGTSLVAVLVGPGVVSRRIVRKEIEFACQAAKPILVIDQDPDRLSELPSSLRSYPWLRHVSVDQLDTLVPTLSRLLHERG